MKKPRLNILDLCAVDYLLQMLGMLQMVTYMVNENIFSP